jgi:hypothetical protein
VRELGVVLPSTLFSHVKLTYFAAVFGHVKAGKFHGISVAKDVGFV